MKQYESKENEKKTKQYETFINIETGDRVDIEKRIIKRNGFMITYLDNLIKLVEATGSKKAEVIKFILRRMSKSENTLIITEDEIVKKTKISKYTVCETLKILEDKNIIRRRKGAIMLNPNVLHRGNEAKQNELYRKYLKFKIENVEI